jgi:hypothetical protein
MTRTYRRKPRCFRNPTTLNAQKVEQKALDDLTYYNCLPSNRLVVRANRSSGAIPSSYDDLDYATSERTKSSLKYRFTKKSCCGNIKYI